jgi:hypothetical protein
MIDQIISQEDQCIEDLVSYLQHDEDSHEERHNDHAKSDYGSDEDEYDQLFMALLSEKEMGFCPVGEMAKPSSEQDQDHDVDMSLEQG